MSKKAYVGLLIFTVLLVILILFVGYLIWGETWQAPSVFKYDILKDTLTITLTVLAVGIAVVGYLIYQVMSIRLQTESARAAHIATTKHCAKWFAYIGFIFWQTYDQRRDDQRREGNSQYLEMAISFTERGLAYFNELPESEAKSREGDELLCKLNNNLGYYLAERHRTEDKDLSRECADYVRERILKYPQHKDHWLDTCTFIDQQYPN